jgi:co-chaperonin GroES (HSP10)
MENKFKGKALNLIVVVEEIFNENKTASGLDLSGIVDANEKQKEGRVVSVENNVQNSQTDHLH